MSRLLARWRFRAAESKVYGTYYRTAAVVEDPKTAGVTSMMRTAPGTSASRVTSSGHLDDDVGLHAGERSGPGFRSSARCRDGRAAARSAAASAGEQVRAVGPAGRRVVPRPLGLSCALVGGDGHGWPSSFLCSEGFPGCRRGGDANRARAGRTRPAGADPDRSPGPPNVSLSGRSAGSGLRPRGGVALVRVLSRCAAVDTLEPETGDRDVRRAVDPKTGERTSPTLSDPVKTRAAYSIARRGPGFGPGWVVAEFQQLEIRTRRWCKLARG